MRWLAAWLLFASLAWCQNAPPVLLVDASGNPYPTGGGTPLPFDPPHMTCYTIVAGVTVPCTFSGGGGGGTVTSVTFTGDGVVDSSTPSTAVTTSGTLPATILAQAANTVFGNFTGSSAAPTFSATPAFAITNLTGSCTACTANVAGSVTNALTMNNGGSGAASGSTYNGGSAVTLSYNTLGAAGTAAANTFSAAQTISVNGAASTSPLLLSGSWLTGGSATTNYPALYLKASGAADGNLNTLGSGLVLNAATGFTGFFLDTHINGGASIVTIGNSGLIQTSNGFRDSSLHAFLSGSTNVLQIFNTGIISWSSTSSTSGAQDTGQDRAAANVIEANLGTAAGSGGSYRAASFQSGGTKFTASGCTSITSTVGGASAGKFTIGANACTVTITFNGATGLTAPNGWSCHANDETTAAGNTALYFTGAGNATTAALSVPATAAASDVIDFACEAY